MKLDITDAHFVELHKKGYTTDMVVILSWINKELSVEHIIKESKKVEVVIKTMIRKGLITEEFKMTKLGIEILDFVSKKTNKKLIKPKVHATKFDEWWEVFPANDYFKINNKTFGPTRTIRQDKETCRLLFNKLVLDKTYTAQEIIDATLYDINLKKERSYKTNSNQLKFLQNSATYLRRKIFDGFVGLDKKEEPKRSSNLGSIDI